MAQIHPQRMTAEIDGDVGIWHETYLVRAGEYEAIYGAMPRYGLAAAGRHVPIAGARDTARGRVGLGATATAPAEAYPDALGSASREPARPGPRRP